MAKENPNEPQNPTPGDVEVLGNGCVRQKSTGRGAYELMSPFVAEADAKLFEWGSVNRGGDRNWEKGCPFSRCVQSMYRHLIKFTMREADEDHDDNLAAIRFWAGAMIHYQEMIRRGILPGSLDDMPHYDVDCPDEAVSDVRGAINNDAISCLADTHRLSNKFAEQRATMNTGCTDGGCFQDSDVDADFDCDEKPSCDECGCVECDCTDARPSIGYDVDYPDEQEMIRRGIIPGSLDDMPHDDIVEGEPLRIYVAGPITANSAKQTEIHNNLGKSIGEFLRSKGHTVFIPHNYEAVLGDEGYEEILKLDFSIIKEWAQALFVIHPSPGANRETALAEELGLPIFRSLDVVWVAKTNS